MRRTIACLFFALLFLSAFAQEAQTPASDTLPKPKPQYWTSSVVTQIGFSQVSLTNWAAGGYGSIALNTYIKAARNYKRDKVIWDNQLQLGYGFIQSYQDGFNKSDDKIILDSKFGYKATEKLYYSTVFNFRSQFTTGYKDKVIVSDFFAPAYISLGLGIDYKPTNSISINFAPLTGKVVMVKDVDLRTKYGNAADQFSKFELGAQFKLDTKIEVEDFKVVSALTLFSDYLSKPLNIKVYWDVNIDANITKFLAVSLRTNLIYDDAIRFLDKKDKKGNLILDENGNTIKVPGVQFKELFSVGFSYTFTPKKK